MMRVAQFGSALQAGKRPAAHSRTWSARITTFNRHIGVGGGVETWPQNRRIRARFGPIVDAPDEMAAILADYY